MSDSLKKTQLMTVSKDVIDGSMLDRVILRHSDETQDANMEGETVLLDLSTGRYYTLNRVGSIIWEHCTGQNTVRDIHAKLCEDFEVMPERALDDLISLINELVQEGLLQQDVKQP